MREFKCRNLVFALFAALLSVGSLTAAEPAAAVPADRPQPGNERPARPPRGGRRGPNAALWAAFSRLSEPERKEMMELQRTDPEKFREVMRKKAEEYSAARTKRHEELKALAGKIREAKDPAEQEVLRKRLSAEIKTDVLNRLAEHRRRIEEMKAHAAKLEKDLDRRTMEVDSMVEKAVQALIEGRELPPPRKGGKMGQPPPRDR